MIRISDSIRFGPFRVGLSVPAGRRGQTRAWVSARTPLGRVTVSRRAGAHRKGQGR
jgi:hypothetical protein